VDGVERPHRQWRDRGDGAQQLYERARRAVLAPRGQLPDAVARTLQAQGVAGLVVDPKRTLVACGGGWSGRRGTAFHHTHLPEDCFRSIAVSLAEGVGVRSTARIFATDKKTVLQVLRRAADHVERVSRSLLRGLTVHECQLDEMWSFVGKKEGHLAAGERLAGLWGDAWIWTAFDAEHKVVLAHVVGKRTGPHAVALLEEVKRVTAARPRLFSSDQLDQYPEALLQVHGALVTPARQPGPGRPPKPRLQLPADLCYVQVVKEYEGYRVAKISRKVVFGDPQRIDQLLAQSSTSHTITTAYVERHNGTVRHLNARCNRKTYRFSKSKANHQRELVLCLGYYHLCRPHRTLSQRDRRPTTPFMSAGLTDHVWTMRELLQCRVT
jgi:IS1 family transposase